MSSKPIPARPRPTSCVGRLKVAAVVVVLVAAVSCAAYWWRLNDNQSRLRQETVALIGQRAMQLADAAAGQVALLARLVDVAVFHLRNDFGGREQGAFDATVRTMQERFPPGALLHISVVDADGRLIYTNLGSREGIRLDDRENFKAHAEGDDSLYVSAPVFDRFFNSWSIKFSRAIRRDGRFLGVLELALAPDYVASSLSLEHLGGNDVIVLFRGDGIYLSRSRGMATVLGRMAPADSPFLRDLTATYGIYRSATAFDRIQRTYAWQRLKEVPLVMTVGLEEATVLEPIEASARRERLRNGVGVTVVMILALGMAALLAAIANRQQALIESEDRYHAMFETNTAIKLLVDPANGRIVDANGAAVAFYGYDREQLLTMRVSDINRLPADAVQAELTAAQQERRQYFRFAHRLKSGEVRHVEVYSGPVTIDGRELLFSVIHDVSARHELEASQRLAQSVFEAVGEAVIVSDASNRIVAVNPAFTKITGYEAWEVKGRNPSLLASGQHDKSFYRLLWQRLLKDDRWEGEISNRRKDGQLYVEWLKIALVRDELGHPQQFVALFSDVTERKRQEDAVWHQANFDTLTGLPNRQLLEDRLGRVLTQAGRRQALVGVLFIDLDRFKPVNDLYGHGAGDDVLCQVAQRLLHSLREEDTVARIGGDEFVAVLSDLVESDAASRTAEKLIAAVAAPYVVGVHRVEISCSIGIAIYPRDAVDGARLIQHADTAMYRAKQKGRGCWSLV